MMSSKILPQFGQVFIHYFSNKSRSTAKVFISEPGKSLEEERGKLFGIVEINTPNKENAKIISQLIADLEQSYYGSEIPEFDSSRDFERALKYVNDQFQAMLDQNAISFVGNLSRSTIKEKIHLAVGVLYGSTLYVTSLNAVGAFLIHRTNQGYSMVDILDGAQTSGSSEKLFENVVSGTVSPQDYLFFCNNDFLNFISKERLLKTITSLSPNRASDYFKNSLLQHEGFNFAAIIVKLLEPVEGEKKAPGSISSIDQLNAQESQTEKLLSPSVMPSLRNIFKKAGSILSFGLSKLRKVKTADYSSDKLTDSEADSVKESPKVIMAEESTAVEMSFNESANIEQPVSKIVSGRQSLLKNTGRWFGSLFESVHYKLSSRLMHLRRNINFQNIKNFLRLRFHQLAQRIGGIPLISRVMLLVLIAMLGLFGYSLLFAKNNQLGFLGGSSQNSVITAVSSTLDEAEAKLIAGDKIEAKRLIALAETDLFKIKVDSSRDRESVDAIVVRMDLLVAKLRNITLVKEPALIYSLPTEGLLQPIITALAYRDDKLYVADKVNGIITEVNTRSRQAIPLKPAIEGAVIRAHPMKDSVGLLTDANKFYLMTPTGAISVPVRLSADDKATDFSFYNDRLYTVIPSKNQIYRHPPEGDGYNFGITWIQNNDAQINGAHTITIDTRIWLATKTAVLKFFKGGQESFSLGEVDPSLENIDFMVKHEDSDDIYLLDTKNNRIVVMNTRGELITQYYSVVFSNLTAFDVDESGKAMYVASGNNIYAVILTHKK